MSLESELLTRLALSISAPLRHEWIDVNSTLPAACITRISGTRDYELDLSDSLKSARIQLDCFDASFEGARSLADAAITSLEGFSGTLGAFTIDSIRVENEASLSENEGDFSRRRISIDFVVVHN